MLYFDILYSYRILQVVCKHYGKSCRNFPTRSLGYELSGGTTEETAGKVRHDQKDYYCRRTQIRHGEGEAGSLLQLIELLECRDCSKRQALKYICSETTRCDCSIAVSTCRLSVFYEFIHLLPFSGRQNLPHHSLRANDSIVGAMLSMPKQVVRAKAASEVFEAILRSKGKRLAGMVKKIPKADKDGFLHQVRKLVQSRPRSRSCFLCFRIHSTVG